MRPRLGPERVKSTIRPSDDDSITGPVKVPSSLAFHARQSSLAEKEKKIGMENHTRMKQQRHFSALTYEITFRNLKAGL